MLHLIHVAKSGCRSLLLSTGDSGVVVIATYVFSFVSRIIWNFICAFCLDTAKIRQCIM